MAYVPHTPLLRRLHSETMMTMGHATWTSRPREDEFEFERSSPFSAVTLSPLNKLRGPSRKLFKQLNSTVMALRHTSMKLKEFRLHRFVSSHCSEAVWLATRSVPSLCRDFQYVDYICFVDVL